MSNRYADDIKRIVGTDEAQGGLSSAPVKSTINGKRGIGYFLDDDIKSATGATNETQAPANADSETPDGQDLDDDGKLVDASDPSKGIFGADTGEYNAKDVLSDDEAAGQGPTLTDVSLLDITAGTLNQLNAEDCASNKVVKLRTDGEFVPPDATFDEAGNKLTELWVDPGIPPELVGWVSGKYWETSGSGNPAGGEQGPTPFSSVTGSISYLNSLTQAELGTDPSDTKAGSHELVDLGPTSPTLYVPEIRRTFNDDSTGTFTLSTGEVDCTATPPTDVPVTCPVAAPVETQWPVQDEFQLTYQDGKFVSSIFDKNTPNEFIQDRSTIPFCYEDGGTKNGEMSALANGHFSVYKTSSAGGPIDGIVRIYNEQGQSIAYTDAAGYNAYLGKLPQSGI